MVRQSLDKPTLIALIFAVLIQIQTSFFAQGDYLGLRVNLADIFLPFIGISILISLFMQKSHWPKWSVSYMWLWLSGLVIVMTISLFRGIEVNGHLSNWALINKYVGFFILLAYFLLGSWISRNTTDIEKLFNYFALVVAGFFVVVVLMSLFFSVLHKYTGITLGLAVNPWSGFMGNRNAFMVISVLVMIFLVFIYKPNCKKSRSSHYIYMAFLLILPIFFFYNASRTGWIVISCLFAILFYKDYGFTVKKAIPLIIVGSFLTFFSSYILEIESQQGEDQYRYLTQLMSDDYQNTDKMYTGDKKRLIAIEDGLDLYAVTGSSLFGAGLGTYKPFQIEKRGEFIDVIDFTVFWLFVETGPLGLLVFVSFFLVCLWANLRPESQNDKNIEILMVSAAFLICFAAMSLLHELLYTRILWFVLGLALGSNQNIYSSSTRLDTRSSSS